MQGNRETTQTKCQDVIRRLSSTWGKLMSINLLISGFLLSTTMIAVASMPNSVHIFMLSGSWYVCLCTWGRL